MGTNLTPYLSFRGNAREAMQFYAGVFGGELQIATFADYGGMGQPEAEQSNVMHAQLVADGAPAIMAADLPSGMPFSPPAGITMALSGDDEPRLRGWFDALSVGAEVGAPMALAPWGDYFGQLTDRFGIPWLVNCAGPDNRRG